MKIAQSNILFLLLMVLSICIASCGNQNDTEIADIRRRLAALESEVATLKARSTASTSIVVVAPTATTLAAPGAVESAPTSAPEVAQAPASATIAAPPAPGSPLAVYNRYMVGNAQPPLPPPSGNNFDVIILKQEENALRTFVRNNTNVPVHSIHFDVIARAADGSMLGTASSSDTTPRWVDPGEVTYTSVGFNSLVLPPDAQFDFGVQAEPAAAGSGYGDLMVTESNRVQKNFVGMATNNSTETASVMRAWLLCFDESGHFLKSYADSLPSDSAEAGQAVPFQVSFNGDSCPTYLLWVSGF